MQWEGEKSCSRMAHPLNVIQTLMRMTMKMTIWWHEDVCRNNDKQAWATPVIWASTATNEFIQKAKKALHYWRTYHFFWLRFHLILMALLVFVFFLDPLASHSLMFIFIHFAYIFFSSLAPFLSWVCTTCIKSGGHFYETKHKKIWCI